jgi:hypothetical protein
MDHEMAVDNHPSLAPVAGTQADSNGMKRMGKVQELNVSLSLKNPKNLRLGN